MAQLPSIDTKIETPVSQFDDETINDVADVALPKSDESSMVDNIRAKLKPLLLYVVSIAQFLDIVNGASVSVAILPIADNLKFNPPQVLWIVNSYTIAFAGLLLLSGRLGDLFGHRRLFLFGLFCFATWALVVSFSSSPIMFVIARALQGASAASTIPTAMALISINYPAGPERTKAFSIFGVFGGMGAVAGLLISGGILAVAEWPWIFRISSIASYLLLILGFFSIPITPSKDERPKVDYIGATTSTLGVTSIVYYISAGVDYGWASPKTLPILFAGLLLIGAFIFAESRIQYPLMPLRLWKNRTFSISVALAFISLAMAQGLIYNVNMVFQEVYGWTAIQTTLGFLVHALLAAVVFGTLGRVLPRLPLKPLILVGFLLRSVASLMFALMNKHTSYWRIPFPALIVHILGIGVTFLPIQIIAVRDADNKDQGLVGAIYSTGMHLGGPFGIAILNVIAVSINTDTHGTLPRGPALMNGYQGAFFGAITLGLIGIVITLVFLPWDKPNRPPQKLNQESQVIKDIEVGSAETIDVAKDITVNDPKEEH
ncbi:hypothetical protein BGX27_001986 [Mortierella sp. AM989]|nr:hypothetical protein BGX27_001986 [Mortierella sp. AM989]